MHSHSPQCLRRGKYAGRLTDRISVDFVCNIPITIVIGIARRINGATLVDRADPMLRLGVDVRAVHVITRCPAKTMTVFLYV